MQFQDAWLTLTFQELYVDSNKKCLYATALLEACQNSGNVTIVAIKWHTQEVGKK